MKLFLVLACLVSNTLAGYILNGGGIGGAGHGLGSGAGYYGSRSGFYGPGAGGNYGSGGYGGGLAGGDGGLGGSYGGLSGSYGGLGGTHGGLSGGYHGGAGGLGVGLNALGGGGGGALGGGGGGALGGGALGGGALGGGALGGGALRGGGAGSRGVVGVVGGGGGGAAADGTRNWHSVARAARVTGSRGHANGRTNGGYGNEAARLGARANRANSNYGHRARDANRDYNGAKYHADKAAANAFDKRHWDGSSHWNRGNRHNIHGRGNNWHQGRRHHDDIDYAYDKKFDLRNNENGGFVLAETDKKHKLDHLKDRAGHYHRNLDKDAAHASAADAQRAQHNLAAFHNDAAHAANSDAYARQAANTAGSHGRNRDWANKLDHSKGGSGLWDDYRRSASNVYKKLATDRGSFHKKGRGAYGLGLPAVGGVAPKPGYYGNYGDGYAGDGSYGSGYVAPAPVVGPGYAAGDGRLVGHGSGIGGGPIAGGHIAGGPVGGGPVIVPAGGVVNGGGGLVDHGAVVGGGSLVSGAGFVSGGPGIVGPGGVLNRGGGHKGAKASRNSLRDALRHSDDAAKAHSTRVRFNRDQHLLHRDTAHDYDRHNAAADKGLVDSAREASHHANKAQAGKADAARAATADKHRAALNENLWKNENEKYRLNDRNNDHRIFKKWFNNKRRGGDNYERLNFDRDNKDDIWGRHAAARKDWSQAGNHNTWNRHHDHRGRNAHSGRVNAVAGDAHVGDWSKDANGYQNANAASGAKDHARRNGYYNGNFARNRGRNAYDGLVRNAWLTHSGASRAGLTGNARGVVGARTGGSGIGHGGALGSSLGGGAGAGLAGALGGGYGGYNGNGYGGIVGSGPGGYHGNGAGGYYGNGAGGYYGNGYGSGRGGAGYGSHSGGHGYHGGNPWKYD